jgi:glycosyltransferase involved in cell wall biosynthesis
MELPFVTVIMPLRNEVSAIVTSLGVIAQVSGERMVIIADGQSTDGTREVDIQKYPNIFCLKAR